MVNIDYTRFTRSGAQAADRRGSPDADAACVGGAAAVVHLRNGASRDYGSASPAGFCRRAAETLLERAFECRFAHEAHRTCDGANEIARMQRGLEPAHGFVEPASAYIFRYAAHWFEEFIERSSRYLQDFAQPCRAEAHVRQIAFDKTQGLRADHRR